MGGGLVIRFDVVTLFPEMFRAVSHSGITGRARERELWKLETWNPREFAKDNYRTIDDRPYGGGPGMVMLAEPLAKALVAVRAAQCGVLGAERGAKVVYLSPQGKRLDHRKVLELAGRQAVTLLCGRYEGVDERLLVRCVDEELSVGDYVLSGGELAAMAVIDAVVRQLPGALGDGQSAVEESFADGLLDCPQYTRPEQWPAGAAAGAVPEVLLSGHHEHIRRWRLKQALGRTWLRRPDLLAARKLNDEETVLLQEYQREAGAAAASGSSSGEGAACAAASECGTTERRQ
jgi:tRNA (guanine37-N1)-methyltransferase